MNNETKSQFMAVATVMSELSEVVVIAKEISLAAANAKAIAFRAGDKARGFQPITDFIGDLSKETIERVATINNLALALYQIAAQEFRMAFYYGKFAEVVRTQDSTYVDSMREPFDSTGVTLQGCRRQFKRNVMTLLTQLEAVMQHAQSARVIAVYSRIEASQAGEYLQSLLSVAESVDKASLTIYENVQRCISALSFVAK